MCFSVTIDLQSLRVRAARLGVGAAPRIKAVVAAVLLAAVAVVVVVAVEAAVAAADAPPGHP